MHHNSEPAGVGNAGQPKTHIGISVRDEFGSLCWADVNTPDTAKATAFYAGLFGWTTETAPDGYILGK
jgi:hypothetical protein